MHLVLTDRLTCSRCGPGFGLILLAEAMTERRVLDGLLGCANCREQYPVVDGFGDLRAPPRTALPEPDPLSPLVDDARAGQLRTLLGASRGTGHTVAVGRAAAWAPALASGSEEGAEVVAIEASTRGWHEAPGVSRLAAGPGLPFFDRGVRGVLLHGADLADLGEVAGDALLDEAARVVADGTRVVVLDPPGGMDARLRAAGLPEALASATLAAAGR